MRKTFLFGLMMLFVLSMCSLSFAKVEKGIGINKESKLEGIRVNNLIGTYLLGPVLVLNPLLTKKILEMLGLKEPKLKYEADLIDAYQKRLEEIRLKVK